MAFEPYYAKRYGRKSNLPRTEAGSHIKTPVIGNVAIKNPVDWGKKCFTPQFKAILSRVLQDRIGTLETEVFEGRMEASAMERRKVATGRMESVNTTQSRVNVMRAALSALDSIPECKG